MNTGTKMVKERRTHERFGVTVEVLWHGRNGRSRGTMSDLGPAGCFVLTGAEVSDGETVHVFLPLGGGMKAQFTGSVTNHEEGIGFGVRFEELTRQQREVVANVIATHPDQ